jgi:hypothetical protein
MRRHSFIFLSFLAAAAVGPNCALAQSSVARVFPAQFGKWKPSGNPIKAAPEPERAELFAEAGLTDWQIQSYTDGTNKVAVILRQFKDPSRAYEAYTSEFTPDMHPSVVGGPSAINQDELLLLVGNLMVEVRPPQTPTTDELQQLEKAVRKYADPTPLPEIRTFLPDGFSDGTQRYALGPVALRKGLKADNRDELAAEFVKEAGFADEVEAMVAEYRKGRDSAGLLLLLYPTPQVAEQHLHHLEMAIPAEAKQAGTTIERKASLLSVVLRPSSAAYASALRKSVNYETQVTWHEPTHKLTDPPWATILGKIFIFTGMFMVVAIALGMAFGGVRVLTKMLFPGKVFDRPEQMDVLQLGLGKNIDSSDFY